MKGTNLINLVCSPKNTLSECDSSVYPVSVIVVKFLDGSSIDAVLCPGSTCNATVVSRRNKRFTTVVETLTTVALLVEPDFYDDCVAQL